MSDDARIKDCLLGTYTPLEDHSDSSPHVRQQSHYPYVHESPQALSRDHAPSLHADKALQGVEERADGAFYIRQIECASRDYDADRDRGRVVLLQYRSPKREQRSL